MIKLKFTTKGGAPITPNAFAKSIRKKGDQSISNAVKAGAKKAKATGKSK